MLCGKSCANYLALYSLILPCRHQGLEAMQTVGSGHPLTEGRIFDPRVPSLSRVDIKHVGVLQCVVLEAAERAERSEASEAASSASFRHARRLAAAQQSCSKFTLCRY